MRFLSFLMALLGALSFAQAWPVNTNSVLVQVGEQVKAEFSIPQGESRVIEARFASGTNGASLSGMVADYLFRGSDDTNWFTAQCSIATGGYVRLTWGPSLDNGSMRYKGWFRALNGSNPIYRLQVDLKMIETPGFVPNATALKLSPVDFNLVDTTNAPWLLITQVDGTSIVVNADGKLSAQGLAAPDLVARQSISDHKLDLNNPHQVTPAQIGAASNTDPRLVNALTDASQFATYAQGLKADAAQERIYSPTGDFHIFEGAIAYVGSDFNVNIPPVIGGQKVKALDHSFYGLPITNVVIPEEVTYIGASSFRFSEIKRIRIPDSVSYIGLWAFENCPYLSSVVVGSGVEYIEREAFANNTALTSIYFSGDAPSVGSDIFAGSAITNVFYLSGRSGFGPIFEGKPTSIWGPKVAASISQNGTTNFPDVHGNIGLPDISGGGLNSAGTNFFRNAANLTNLVGAGIATNAGSLGAGYYAMSNGVWTLIVPGAGGGTSTGGVTSAQVSNIVNGAVSNWAWNAATATINADGYGMDLTTGTVRWIIGGYTNLITMSASNVTFIFQGTNYVFP